MTSRGQDCEGRTEPRYLFDDFYHSREDRPILVSDTIIEPSSNYEAYERGQQLLRAAECTIAPLLQKLDDLSASALGSQFLDFNDSDIVRINTLVNNAIKDLDIKSEGLKGASISTDVKRKLVPFITKPPSTATSLSGYSGDQQFGRESGGVPNSLPNPPRTKYEHASLGTSGRAYKDMDRARQQVAEACEEALNVATSLKSFEAKCPRTQLHSYRGRPMPGETVHCPQTEDTSSSGQARHYNTPVTSMSPRNCSERANVLAGTYREDMKRSVQGCDQDTIPTASRCEGEKIQKERVDDMMNGRVPNCSRPTQTNFEKTNVVTMELSDKHSNTGIFVVKSIKKSPISEEKEKMKKFVIQETPSLVIPRECVVQRGYHIDYPPGRYPCPRRNVMVSEVIYDKELRHSEDCGCNFREDDVNVSRPLLFDVNHSQRATKSRQGNNLGLYSFLDNPQQHRRENCSEKKTCQSTGRSRNRRTHHGGLQEHGCFDGGNGCKDTFKINEYSKTEREVGVKSPRDCYPLGSNSGRDRSIPKNSVTNGKSPTKCIELKLLTVDEEVSVSNLNSSQGSCRSKSVERAGFEEVPCACNTSFASSSEMNNAENIIESNVNFLFSKIETLEDRSNQHTTRVTEILKYLATDVDQKSTPFDNEAELASANRDHNEVDDIRRDVRSLGKYLSPVREKSNRHSGKKRSPERNHTTKGVSVDPADKKANRKVSPSRKGQRKISPGKQEHKDVSPVRQESRKVFPGGRAQRKVSPGKPGLRNEQRETSPGHINAMQVALCKPRKVKATNRAARRKFPVLRSIAKQKSKKLATKIKMNINSQDVVPIFGSRLTGNVDLPRVVAGKCVDHDCGALKRRTRSKRKTGEHSLSPTRAAKGVGHRRNLSSTSNDKSDLSCQCPETIPPYDTTEKPVPQYQQRMFCRPVCHPPVRITPLGDRVISSKPNCSLTGKHASKDYENSANYNRVHGVKKTKRSEKSRSPDCAQNQTIGEEENSEWQPLPEVFTTNETPDTYRKIYVTSRDPSPAASIASDDENVWNLASPRHPTENDPVSSREVNQGSGPAVCLPARYVKRDTIMEFNSPTCLNYVKPNKDIGVQCDCDLKNDSLDDLDPRSGLRQANLIVGLQRKITEDVPKETYPKSRTETKEMGIQCDYLQLIDDSFKDTDSRYPRESRSSSPLKVPKSGIEKKTPKIQGDYLSIPVPAPRQQSANSSIECLRDADNFDTQSNMPLPPRGESVRESSVKQPPSELSTCASQLAAILSELTYNNQLLNAKIDKLKDSEERQREGKMKTTLDSDSCDCVEGEISHSETIEVVEKCPASTKPTIVPSLTTKEDTDGQEQKEAKIMNIPKRLSTRKEDTVVNKNVPAGKSTTSSRDKIDKTYNKTGSKSGKDSLTGKSNLPDDRELRAASLASKRPLSSNIGDIESNVVIEKGVIGLGESKVIEETTSAGSLYGSRKNPRLVKSDSNSSNAQFKEEFEVDENGTSNSRVHICTDEVEVEQSALGYDDDPVLCYREECVCRDLSSDDNFATTKAATSGDTLSSLSEGEIRSQGEIRLRCHSSCICHQVECCSVEDVADYYQGNNLADIGCRSSGEVPLSDDSSSENACDFGDLSAGELRPFTNTTGLDHSKEMAIRSSSSLGNIDIDLQIESTSSS